MTGERRAVDDLQQPSDRDAPPLAGLSGAEAPERLGLRWVRPQSGWGSDGDAPEREPRAELWLDGDFLSELRTQQVFAVNVAVMIAICRCDWVEGTRGSHCPAWDEGRTAASLRGVSRALESGARLGDREYSLKWRRRRLITAGP